MARERGPADSGVFLGRDPIRAFLLDFLGCWESFEQSIEESRESGGRVAVFIHLVAVGRGSSAKVDARYAHAWTMREGLGARVDAYYDRDEALAAIDP